MMRGLLRLLPIAAAVLASGCAADISPTGADEPMRIEGATFVVGELPGTPEDAEGSAEPVGPQVTSLELTGASITQGEQGKSIGGRTSEDAWSIAVAYGDETAGYWIRPVDGADPTQNNERGFALTANFARDLEPGLHTIRAVAIDGEGRAGLQRSLSVCVAPAVPDNLNACRATLEPPDVVISLDWIGDADLDLVVVSPDGKVVSPKAPTSAPLIDGVIDTTATGVGILDRDARCGGDTTRRENLVFNDPPAPGRWLVYANLFESCDASSAIFNVSIHVSEPTDEGFTQRLAFERSGTLYASDANGGDALGTFVFEITF